MSINFALHGFPLLSLRCPWPCKPACDSTSHRGLCERLPSLKCSFAFSAAASLLRRRPIHVYDQLEDLHRSFRRPGSCSFCPEGQFGFVPEQTIPKTPAGCLGCRRQSKVCRLSRPQAQETEGIHPLGAVHKRGAAAAQSVCPQTKVLQTAGIPFQDAWGLWLDAFSTA